jgi:hypothetical protein
MPQDLLTYQITPITPQKESIANSEKKHQPA